MSNNKGTVIQVMGPVLDIRFADDQLPKLLSAIEVPNGENTIVAEVAQHIGDNVVRSSVIGLSALMTTTMMRMKEVVEYAKQENIDAKIMIGGAVITQSFAEEIGADGYSKDAQEAVEVVQKLLNDE